LIYTIKNTKTKFEALNQFKVRREGKPKQERVERRQLQVEDTKSARAQVTTEKVTVSRRDVTQLEQMTERKYPKQDIGRIVIEEIPERKVELKRETPRREVVRKREPEIVATRHEVVPREYVKEEVIKVRQSDFTPVTGKDIIQRIDRVDGKEQVCSVERNPD
jgi:hypothetical protein